MSEGPPTPPRLRRNGQLQSCEPCRKSKLRCDHATPCSRCSRLDRTPMCVYHPAPMARSSSIAGVSRKKSKNKCTPPHSTISTPPARSPYCKDPFALEAGGSLGYARAPTRFSTGYMGMTGHSAVFLDSKISADAWREIGDADDTAQGTYQNTSKQTKFGTNILAWLPSQTTLEAVIDHWVAVHFCVTLSHTVMLNFLREFWEHYQEHLEEPRKPENLVKITESLCNNTAKPMKLPRTNTQWLSSFCGSNSRWEMVGMLFVLCGGAFILPDTHHLLLKLIPADMSKHSFALSMLECADACLILCEELDPPGNLLSLILLYRCCCLQSCVRGDTSESPYIHA